jgi:putative transposase
VTVLWRCRELYNAGLQERKAAWEQCRVTVTVAMQSAQLPGTKQVRPDYRDLNAQVLQDVLHRPDRAFAALGGELVQGHASFLEDQDGLVALSGQRDLDDQLL